MFSYTENVQKFLHAYNFTMKIFPTTTHQHFPNCCCPYILVYVVASNTTSHLLFSSAHGVISSINAHHTRLVKLFLYNLVCPEITLCKYIFFDEHLLDEIKANYGASWESFATCSKEVNQRLCAQAVINETASALQTSGTSLKDDAVPSGITYSLDVTPSNLLPHPLSPPPTSLHAK